MAELPASKVRTTAAVAGEAQAVADRVDPAVAVVVPEVVDLAVAVVRATSTVDLVAVARGKVALPIKRRSETVVHSSATFITATSISS